MAVSWLKKLSAFRHIVSSRCAYIVKNQQNHVTPSPANSRPLVVALSPHSVQRSTRASTIRRRPASVGRLLHPANSRISAYHDRLPRASDHDLSILKKAWFVGVSIEHSTNWGTVSLAVRCRTLTNICSFLSTHCFYR